MNLNEKLRHSELLCLMRNANASDVVQAFLDWLSETKDKQEKSWQIVIEEDSKVQDFLHEMEFEPSNKKRAVISTRLHDSRVKRRSAKDTSKLLKPVTDFVRDATNRNLIKMMKQLRTDLKSVEDYVFGERTYKPRGGDEG